MSIKSFCPWNCVSPPPPPQKGVNFEDFLLICTVFLRFGPFFFGGGGGLKPNFADKNLMDTQTFLILFSAINQRTRLKPHPISTVLWVQRKFPQSIVKPALPSKEQPATVLRAPPKLTACNSLRKGHVSFPWPWGSQETNSLKIVKKRLLQRSEGNFSEQSPGWILRGIFLVDFLGRFLAKEQDEKIHPKIHSKIQIGIWEFRGQNPHCKDLALN